MFEFVLDGLINQQLDTGVMGTQPAHLPMPIFCQNRGKMRGFGTNQTYVWFCVQSLRRYLMFEQHRHLFSLRNIFGYNLGNGSSRLTTAYIFKIKSVLFFCNLCNCIYLFLFSIGSITILELYGYCMTENTYFYMFYINNMSERSFIISNLIRCNQNAV